MIDDKRRSEVCVIGLGYIGLPTASVLATRGFSVRGVDVDPRIVDRINGGDIHIQEPELDVLVRSAVHSGYLSAATEPGEADVFLIAVPTPFCEGNKPDLTHVEAVARGLAGVLQAGDLVILESTVPVGTTERMAQWIFERRPDLADGSLHIAHCPERVLPGRILQELVENDRVVGGIDEQATAAAATFYRRFLSGDVLPTTARTAEMAKLTENTFRDVNIAFANELSLICDQFDIDIWHLLELANRHPRVNILQPGPGVGGHCIAVDPWFIVDAAPESAGLIRKAREVNDYKPEHVVHRVSECAARLRDPVIACLGLAYKPDVDDLRESPAVRITRTLAEKRLGTVLAVEPYARHWPDGLRENGVQAVALEEALERADIVVALVPHRPFCDLSSGELATKVVVDTCGLMQRLQ